MYALVVRQFARSLKNLDTVLAKAEKYAEGRKFDVDNFLTARLAPDMLPFATQIRIACDTAKGTAANLAGQEAPKHEDNETTFAELRGRIAKCLAYLEGLGAKDFEHTKPDTLIKLPESAGGKGCMPTNTCSPGRSRTSTSMSRPPTICSATAASTSESRITSASSN